MIFFSTQNCSKHCLFIGKSFFLGWCFNAENVFKNTQAVLNWLT